MKTALVFGATGLSGTALIEVLVNDKRYSHIKIFNRKPSVYLSPKVEEIIIDFNHLDLIADQLKGDVVFSCLGTTLSKSGSKAAQQVIDRDYPIAIAKLAAQNKVQQYIAVSSVGTNASTNNFYLKTKFEMEVGVKQYFNDKAVFMRPSFLLGNRKEMRLGEKIGIVMGKLFSFFLIGSMKKYRGMHVQILAKALVNAPFLEIENKYPEFEMIMVLSNSQ
jgi:uncharacterized protein YbjT (DUF2867 family)